jgi:hypothetical protein
MTDTPTRDALEPAAIIAEIEKALDGTTPGRWTRTENEHDGSWTDVTVGRYLVCRVPWSRDTCTSAHRDADFIAACRPDNMHQLLRAIEAERQRADRAEAERDTAQGLTDAAIEDYNAALAIIRICQSTLALMVAPDAIRQTTVIHAYASAAEAETKCRRFLNQEKHDEK